MWSNNEIQKAVDEITVGMTEPSRGWSLNEAATCCVYWCLVHRAWRKEEELNKRQAIKQLQEGPLSGRSKGSIEAKTMNVTSAAQELLQEGLQIYHEGRYIKRGDGTDNGPMVCKGYAPAPNKQKELLEILPKTLKYFELLLTEELNKDTSRKTPPINAWLMLSKVEPILLGSGYDDETSSHYSWDDTVPNHASPSVGDAVVLWNGKELFGASQIDAIETGRDRKLRYRCPGCKQTALQARKELMPKYKCGNCKLEVEEAEVLEEQIEIDTYRAHYASSWNDMAGELEGSQLRSLCYKPDTIHSIRELDWKSFLLALREGIRHSVARLIRPPRKEIPGGHKERKVRVRTGQAAFRKKLLSRYGETCALSGPAPEDAIDAAHLYSYAAVGKHDEMGGLLIRKDLHRLFDLGLIRVDPKSLIITIDESLSHYPGYRALDAQPLYVKVAEETQNWLQQHWDLWNKEAQG